MLTARANTSHAWLRRRTRSAERGQIMPIFAILAAIIILFASLLIDGSFAFQTFRDLDTIAYHAARAGANEVLRPCNVPAGSTCPLRVADAPGLPSAKTTAETWARNWATQDNLTLVVNNATVSGSTVTIHLRACYAFFLPLAPIFSGVCPAGNWQFDSFQTARSLVGP